jgi:hypothetical protein
VRAEAFSEYHSGKSGTGDQDIYFFLQNSREDGDRKVSGEHRKPAAE